MLTADGLLDDARSLSGLEDYGDMTFAQGLRVLVASLNAEAELTPEERARTELVRTLVNRLRMQRDITRHPEILDEEILPPVYITALPRTGSTKLQHLLAATGDFNAMKYWQAHNFARIADRDAADPDPRVALGAEHLSWIAERSPLLMQTHPMFNDEVDEELDLLDASFHALYWHAMLFNVPSYAGWVMSLDGRWALQDLRRILQYMQWQHFPGKHRRWILKTPALLGREDVIAEVFPGTDFIVTHRAPDKITASAAATFVGIRNLYYERDYSDVAGQMAVAGFIETIKGHLAWREQYPDDKVLDIRFEDIISDDHGVLSEIYTFLGLDFDDDSRVKADAWLAMDDQRREEYHHAQKPELADYGLDAAGVRDWFAGYIDRYERYL